MPAAAPRPVDDRWGDVEGSHISLFCHVEQVAESGPRGLLPSRLHQQGQVVGRGSRFALCVLRGQSGGQPVTRLLRLLPDAPGGAAHREGP
ncbi:MAG: hypothetical protein ACRDSF_14310 [Pseudonocardiaceae bacterium]